MTNTKIDISFYSFFKLEVVFRAILILYLLNNTLHFIAFSSSMEIYFLIVLTKVVLMYTFVKLQDTEKETEFNFLLGLRTDIYYFVVFVFGVRKKTKTTK